MPNAHTNAGNRQGTCIYILIMCVYVFLHIILFIFVEVLVCLKM